MLVSPRYSSCQCNGRTFLVMFMKPFRTGDINSFDVDGADKKFLVWPLWILTCLGSTLGLVIFLSVTAPSSSLHLASHKSSSAPVLQLAPTTSNQSSVMMILMVLRSWLVKRVSHPEATLAVNSLVFAFWAILIACKYRRYDVVATILNHRL